VNTHRQRTAFVSALDCFRLDGKRLFVTGRGYAVW
jgi:hypothetical protein